MLVGECIGYTHTDGLDGPSTYVRVQRSSRVKKGRHRRYEEARALKRTSDDLDQLLETPDAEPCPECGVIPGLQRPPSWCMAPGCVAIREQETTASNDLEDR